MCGLYEYIKREKITTPIKLQLVLHKVVHKSDGNDVRYFRVKIEGKDVTQMVADAADLKVITKPCLFKSQKCRISRYVLIYGLHISWKKIIRLGPMTLRSCKTSKCLGYWVNFTGLYNRFYCLLDACLV